MADTKLCLKCNRVLPLLDFGMCTKYGRRRPKSQCKQCLNEYLRIYTSKRKEANGTLFSATRRFDSLRADRLDEHRRRAKLELPMICDNSMLPQSENNEYGMFYVPSTAPVK